jgi:hypothetical protein
VRDLPRLVMKKTNPKFQLRSHVDPFLDNELGRFDADCVVM